MPPFYIDLEQTFDTLLDNTNIIYQVLRLASGRNLSVKALAEYIHCDS